MAVVGNKRRSAWATVRAPIAILALVAQIFFVCLLADWWVSYGNVAGGECGWDGSCVDDTVGPVMLTSSVGALVGEFAIVLLQTVPAWLAQRDNSDGRQRSLARLIVGRLPTVIFVFFWCTLVLVVQNSVIGWLTNADDRPVAWAANARAFLNVSVTAIGLDIVVGFVMLLVIARQKWLTRDGGL